MVLSFKTIAAYQRMALQLQIAELIRQRSPEATTLRGRAISGNKQYLQHFCGSLCLLLKDSANHALVYEQVNQFLISAQPSVIAGVSSTVLLNIQRVHQDSTLDWYIRLWRAFGFYHPKYSVLIDTLNNINLGEQGSLPSELFEKCYSRFKKNASHLLDNRIQFFGDSLGTSLSLSIFPDQSEMSSEIIRQQMKQLQGIRRRVQTDHISQTNAEDQYKKVRRFLKCKPRSLRRQMSLGFNNDRIWAQQFVQNYETLKKSDSINVCSYPTYPHPDLYVGLDAKKAGSRNGESNQGILEKDWEQKSVEMQINPGNEHSDQHQTQNISIRSGKARKHQPSPIGENQISFHHTQPKKQQEGLPIMPGKGLLQSHLNRDQFGKSIQAQSQNKAQPRISHQSIGKSGYQIISVDHGSAFQSQTIPYSSANFNKMYSPQNLHNPSWKEISKPIAFAFSPSSSKNSKQRPRPKIFRNKYSNQDSPEKIISDNKETHSSRGKQKSQHATKEVDRNQNVQAYQNRKDYAGLMQSPFHRLTFLSDRSPLSSEDNLLRNPTLFPGHKGSQNQVLQLGSAGPSEPRADVNPDLPLKPKKLSQLKREKNERMETLGDELFQQPDEYVAKPYRKNLRDKEEFKKFKKKCLSNHPVLFQHEKLVVRSQIERVYELRVKILVTFVNRTNSRLAMQTIYRIPKSMKYQTHSKVHSLWLLEGTTKQSFELQLVSLPLEPCLLDLNFIEEENYPFQPRNPITITLPVTLRNFLNLLVATETEWWQKWEEWEKQKNFQLRYNILLDNQTLSELQSIGSLPQFSPLQPTGNISVEQAGALGCQPSLNNLHFLLRFSKRLRNVATIQLLADRRLSEGQDEYDFLFYLLDLWGLLLAQLD